MTFEQILDTGIYRNILVYDVTAEKAEPTERLISNMLEVHEKNPVGNSPLTKFILSDLHDIDFPSVQFVKDDDWKILEGYFLSHNGVYPEGKSNLIVGIDDNNKVLLGAF